VGKSRDEQQVVQLLCSLIDDDDDLECFFYTGLSLNPFLKETSLGRSIKYVPLPLLSFKLSLGLIHSFVAGSQSVSVSSKLARFSGESFQILRLLLKIRVGSMVETVVDSTMAMANRCLEDTEIMLLLRPHTSISDI
jgi:hypothetical protein